LFGSFFVLALLLGGIRIVNDRVDAEEELSTTMQVNVLSHIEGYKAEMDEFLKQRLNQKMPLLRAVSERTRENISKLAFNLQFASMSDLRVITITSTTPGEGKSSVALMLACQLAKEGKSVLLADMDYRSPMIGRYLGQRGNQGIFEYLSDKAAFKEVVIQTKVSNLFFADVKHKMNMTLNNERISHNLERFIEEARQYFDMVIFDTAPLGMFIDAAAVAAKSDGTVVVVADGRVKRKELVGVLKQLSDSNAKVLGVAFNFVHHKQSKYYYSKYYRYGEQHREERKMLEGKGGDMSDK
jgi:capsular exopolysaccharide synthesis family protein